MSRNPWEDKKTYKIVRSTVYIIEAPLSAPVRWYTEYHYNGRYIASFGSRAWFRLLAVIVAIYNGRPQV